MYNICSYLLYFLIGIPVILWVGKRCFQVGRLYILDIFDDAVVCDTINKMLLLGYYLLNIGFTVYSISTWNRIENLQLLVSTVFIKLSVIFLIISVIHYINLAALYFFRKQILSTFK